jgi:KTSC domain
MKEPTFETTVNGKTVTCDPNLKGFKIFKKQSSFINYFATHHVNKDGGDLFIQFNDGNCAVFFAVPKEVLDLSETSESIGKFYHAFIKGKYPEQSVGDNCIVEKVEPVEDDEDWDMNHFPDSVDFDI